DPAAVAPGHYARHDAVARLAGDSVTVLVPADRPSVSSVRRMLSLKMPSWCVAVISRSNAGRPLYQVPVTFTKSASSARRLARAFGSWRFHASSHIWSI